MARVFRDQVELKLLLERHEVLTVEIEFVTHVHCERTFELDPAPADDKLVRSTALGLARSQRD